MDWRDARPRRGRWASRLGGRRRRPSTSARTMRVDYFHTRRPASRRNVSLDRVVNDGAWPGSRTQLVDPTNLGKYLFEVRDARHDCSTRAASHRSTANGRRPAEAKKTQPARFTSRCGSPGRQAGHGRPVRNAGATTAFSPVWSTEIDPASRFVNAAPPRQHAGRSGRVFENGPTAEKVDLLVISEGYTAGGDAEISCAT